MVRQNRAIAPIPSRAGVMLRAALMAMALVPLHAGAARADANCMARVLSDVPAEEAPEQVKSKQSGAFGPINAVKVEKQSGKMFYCAASSYCYGSNSFQITTPCRFKLDKEDSSGRFFVYSAR